PPMPSRIFMPRLSGGTGARLSSIDRSRFLRRGIHSPSFGEWNMGDDMRTGANRRPALAATPHAQGRVFEPLGSERRRLCPPSRTDGLNALESRRGGVIFIPRARRLALGRGALRMK